MHRALVQRTVASFCLNVCCCALLSCLSVFAVGNGKAEELPVHHKNNLARTSSLHKNVTIS